MHFDPNNPVIELCSKGMTKEMEGDNESAAHLFIQAWDIATSDFEKFTAAHYIARHQKTIADKLSWDETALNYAMKINDKSIQSSFPSLYLNIGKCYEDLDNIAEARNHYQLAHSFTELLPDNEYGKMIKNGIMNALERVTR